MKCRTVRRVHVEIQHLRGDATQSHVNNVNWIIQAVTSTRGTGNNDVLFYLTNVSVKDEGS